MHHIDAVVVCNQFSDYLAQTLPVNMEKVDKLIVVSTPWDKKTITLCQRYGIECIQTEVFFNSGDKFNKARGINLGLAHLKLDDMVIQLDADIVLPPNFRKFLKSSELDNRNIFGMDRVRCIGRKSWDDYKLDPKPMFEWSWLVCPPDNMPLGGRIAHNEYNGYLPIGYFQMWNPKVSGVSRYPERQGSAEHTDVLFALKFPRPRRVLLPEMFCIHLETIKKTAPMGSDWSGRKTPAFTIDEGPFPLSGPGDMTGSDVNPDTIDQYFS